MIYVDSSVLLARLLSEDRKPADRLWTEDLVSSRLATYEVWGRIHALQAEAYARAARDLLGSLLYTELTPVVLERALEPFPLPLRTLDALHVASIDHLRRLGASVSLATFDRRMTEAARVMDIPLWEEL